MSTDGDSSTHDREIESQLEQIVQSLREVTYLLEIIANVDINSSLEES